MRRVVLATTSVDCGRAVASTWSPLLLRQHLRRSSAPGAGLSTAPGPETACAPHSVRRLPHNNRSSGCCRSPCSTTASAASSAPWSSASSSGRCSSSAGGSGSSGCAGHGAGLGPDLDALQRGRTGGRGCHVGDSGSAAAAAAGGQGRGLRTGSSGVLSGGGTAVCSAERPRPLTQGLAAPVPALSPAALPSLPPAARPWRPAMPSPVRCPGAVAVSGTRCRTIASASAAAAEAAAGAGAAAAAPVRDHADAAGSTSGAVARTDEARASSAVSSSPQPPPPPQLRRTGQPAASPHPPPQLPLCMRPAVHVDELAAALAWKADMAARIAELGDALERADGGPDAAGLLREIDWVLDDAIEAFRPQPDAAWEATSWRALEPLARAEARRRAAGVSGWQLRMRAPVAALRQWWERRLRDRVPFQYLISTAHWHTYVLGVGPGVLIPRPETEIFPTLVSEALQRRPGLAAAPWADLGTGSGAIAISAADVLRRRNPAAEVWAVDISPTALAYAAFNARLVLGSSPDGGSASSSSPSSSATASPSAATAAAAANANVDAASGGCRHVRFALGSWCEPLLAAGLAGRLGGLLSNPPYIPREQMDGLQAEVGRHEPSGALDGGEGPGLDSLQALCSQAAQMLMPGGLIALETAGGEQAELVAQILRHAALPHPDALGACSDGTDGAEGSPGGLRRVPVGAGSTGSSGGGECDGRSSSGDGSAADAAAASVEPEPEAAAVGAAFEDVEVLEDCYGVRRFVRAYRRG